MVQQDLPQLVDKDAPLVLKMLGWLIFIGLTIPAVFILPILLWGNFWVNKSALVIILNQDGYSQQTFQIREYCYLVDVSGPDIHKKRYFAGSIGGKNEYYEDMTFVYYSNELGHILETTSEGCRKLEMKVDVWYNSSVKDRWPDKFQAIVPYKPNIFNSLRIRLVYYLLLIGLWLCNWYVIYAIPECYKIWRAKRQMNESTLKKAKLKGRGR